MNRALSADFLQIGPGKFEKSDLASTDELRLCPTEGRKRGSAGRWEGYRMLGDVGAVFPMSENYSDILRLGFAI